jgi:hypothetical protein
VNEVGKGKKACNEKIKKEMKCEWNWRRE